MARDANLVLQSAVTKSADFNGDVTPAIADIRRGKAMYARVTYSNTSTASGSATADFYLDVSYDGGSNWTTNAFRSIGTVNIPSGSANAVAGEVFIPFEVSKTSANTPVKLRVTLDYTASSSPSAPSITYFADVVPGRPG